MSLTTNCKLREHVAYDHSKWTLPVTYDHLMVTIIYMYKIPPQINLLIRNIESENFKVNFQVQYL